MTEYEPQWDNPRQRAPLLRRVRSVLAWCKFMLNEVSPTPIHHDTMIEIFGSRGNPLTKYLKDALLVRDGAYVVGQTSYGYRLNRAGFKKLSEIVAATPTQYMVSIVNPVTRGHEDELSNLTFKYKDQSDRLWHPLQNLKRDSKREFWSSFGLNHDYDIQACAPTVLFQLANRHGLLTKHLTALQGYLDDRQGLRAHVAALANVSVNDAKRLINSLFNGARLAANHRCRAYALVGHDQDAMKRLQDDPTVLRIRREVQAVWKSIELAERMSKYKTEFDDQGNLIQTETLRLKTGKAKWSVYYRYERQILNTVVEYLKSQSNRHFTEHDGFRTEHEVNVKELEAWILDKTGFKITIDKD